jgi:hypothetical protein
MDMEEVKMGKESYETLRTPKGERHIMYSYRHPDGRLFSVTLPTLEKCREHRDKWLLKKKK